MKLRLENVTKTYGQTVALNSITLDIGFGIFGLIGRNGSGKTTLLRVLSGEFKPSKGRVTLDGGDISLNPDYSRIIGYLPQRSKTIPVISLYSYLEFACIYKKIKAGERRNEIFRCLKAVGLENQYKRRLSDLSDGMLRRAEIASVMVGDPKILVLDCPTAGLDPEERLSFYNLLYSLGPHKAIILSTQILDDAERLCDSVAILDRGRLVYAGATTELILSLLDKTWECTLTPEAEALILKKTLVTSVRYRDGMPLVRYVDHSANTENSEKTIPTLHDAYINALGGLKISK